MTSHPKQPNGESRGHVLVLEDDPRLQHMLSTVLRLENYDVEGVSSGSSALTAIENRPPDLMVLDLIVPDVSGWEVARRLRADPASAGIPILVVSSVQDLAVEAQRMGADDHLAKPFLAQDLVNKVLDLLNRRRLADVPSGV
ncbi:MAG TPA: response regulator [Dehalococcoidia bacterium]|nr:response regulator [Dehalococcoidia bacterium]